MKDGQSLIVTIPKPCQENWEAMQHKNHGRHCEKCNHIVHDFSAMDDEELIRSFKESFKVPCGRFHNSQLGRAIEMPKKRKPFFNKFNKAAAALFTILSLKNIEGKAQNKNEKTATIANVDAQKKIIPNNEKAIISGTIKNGDGIALEHAKIILDTTQVAETDQDGNFSFEFLEGNTNSHNLYFSYDSLVTVVRNYHLAMMSTKYDVKLLKPAPSGERFSMGVPIFYEEISDSLKFVVFKPGSKGLSKAILNKLDELAYKLKANPSVNISLISHNSEVPKYYIIREKRINAITKYLVEQKGILSDRISDIFISEGDENTIDILVN